MIELETSDIQGLVFRGYRKNSCARYLLLEITDADRARAWLSRIAGGLAVGESRYYDVTANLAITASGLRALGLPELALASFSREFREGMSSDEHRSRILGDTDDSAPGSWQWGGPGQAPVHLMLLVYAPDPDVLEETLARHRAEYAGALRVTFLRDTVTLSGRREHFGFADGIAQPAIEGSRRAGPDAVKAGEFVLGYPNAYGKLPVSPSVPASLDRGHHLLPPPGGDSSARDLGRNGTYLVVRQLEQDVAGFWQAMAEYGRDSSGNVDRHEATRLAAKCVGRWPSGAPLVSSPDSDNPAFAQENGFLYAADPHGLACPIGSHIRRTNPRDSLEPGPAESLRVVERHRILRRGRSYGPPLEPFARESERAERGLFFICLNANIRRQFEFIQQTWSNNPKFGGLAVDKDPLIGDQPLQGGTFTIPAAPVRRRLERLARFVRVRGGEYFFLPSVRALRFLAALTPFS